MDVETYKILRKEFKEDVYADKYNSLMKWLLRGSYLGNMVSIFFAYFLVFPFLHKAATINIADNTFVYVTVVILSIGALVMFEFTKREILKGFSREFIKEHFKIYKKVYLGLITSILALAFSFYLSLNGAVEFANTSQQKNVVVETNTGVETDSLRQLYTNRIIPIEQDNEVIRESIKSDRGRVTDLPDNWVTVRKNINKDIKDNQELLDKNEQKVRDLNSELENEIEKLKQQSASVIQGNEEEDLGLLWLFLISSTLIEILIVAGVFYHRYYNFRSFKESESKYEPLYHKREKFGELLSVVFRKGEVLSDEPVITVNRLVSLLKNRGWKFPKKEVNEFYSELTDMGIFAVQGNKRYTKMTYDDAIKTINSTL